MKGRVVALAAAMLVALAAPVSLNAQTLYAGFGATFPTGDFGDFAGTGWMGIAGILFNDIGTEGLSLGVEGLYGENSHDSDDLGGSLGYDAKTNPYGIMGIVDYTFATGGKLMPYIFGGAGWLAHKYSEDVDGASFSETDSGFGFQFGGGVAYPVSQKVSIFGEGRYVVGTGDVDGTTFWGLFGGLAFGLGN